jgi:HSP20 family molecular chaperone IbpA
VLKVIKIIGVSTPRVRVLETEELFMKNYVVGYNPLFNVDPFFNEFFKDDVSSQSLMKTDIKEFDSYYELRINVPGIKKEDIKLSLKNGYLHVNIEFKKDESNDGKYLVKERFQGKATRSFYIGDKFTIDDIKAKLLDGILTLTINKIDETKEKEDELIAIE